MITTFDLWEELIGTANTHQGGHVKPHRNFLKWVKSISLEIFKEMCEEYQKSQVMSDELTIFLKTVNINVPVVPSQMWDLIVLPPDYQYFASARIYRRGNTSCGCELFETIDGKTGKQGRCDTYIDEDELALIKAEADNNLCEIPIDKVSTNRWSAVCSHVNLKPDINNAKITQFDKGFKLAPKRLGVIILDYFREPQEPTFDYTILNQGEENEYIQFNATTSKPLEWRETMRPEFIARLQKKYGRFVREAVIEQAGKDDSNI